MASSRHFEAFEDNAIVDWMPMVGPSALADRLGRSVADVCVRASFLGVRASCLSAGIPAAPAPAPVVSLQESVVSVAEQAAPAVVSSIPLAGLSRGRGRAWTQEDDDTMHAVFAAGGNLGEVASAVGRTPRAVRMHISAPVIKGKASSASASMPFSDMYSPAYTPVVGGAIERPVKDLVQEEAATEAPVKEEPVLPPVPDVPKPRPIPRNEDPEPGWIRVAEFIKRTGLTSSVAYSFCHTGKIKARKGLFGRYEVLETEVDNPVVKAEPQPRIFAPWSEEEDTELIDAFSRGGDAETARVFEGRRTPAACKTRISVLQRKGRITRVVKAAAKAAGRPAKRPWSEEDDARLTREWRPGCEELLAVKMGRLPESILSRAKILGLVAYKKHMPWMSGDDARLREYWYQSTVPELAVTLGRTESAVRDRANILGLPAHRKLPDAPLTAEEAIGLGQRAYAGHWTKAQDQELRDMFNAGDPVSEMAIAMGRPAQEVRARIDALGLKSAPKGPKPGAVWKAEEDEVLRRLSFLGAETLAARLGRSVEDVQARLKQAVVDPSSKRGGWRGQRRLVALGESPSMKVKGGIGAGMESVRASALEERGSGLDMGEKLAILRSLAAGGSVSAAC